MKNKLTDLNDHLFAQIERLSNEEIDDETLTKEIRRAESIVKVGAVVVDNANTALKGAQLQAEFAGTKVQVPKMIGAGSESLDT